MRVTRSSLRKTTTSPKKDVSSEVGRACTLHKFTSSEILVLRSNLLEWYNNNKRDLPWRNISADTDSNQKAYAVLVSEVMLQQTQVVTVEKYYKKWIVRWPTLQALATASLEEVNEMWSGLGYYARGRRLYETARKVVHELGGHMPTSAQGLQKLLPGVGRYTAGAVASIVFGEKSAAVDGNVIRVLARLRLIGADSNDQVVVKDMWNIAESLVDPMHPGDFNQAMMELGATVCTFKSPNCSACPLQSVCLAYRHKDDGLKDIEEAVPDCTLCLPKSQHWDFSLGVANFPRKAKKTPPRQQRTVVCILIRKGAAGLDEFFLVKRPAKGLLANLWEFPSIILTSSSQKNEWAVIQKELVEQYRIDIQLLQNKEYVGDVVHIFSHIHQVYAVYKVKLEVSLEIHSPKQYQGKQWLTEVQFGSSAVSTAVIKILKALRQSHKEKVSLRKRKCSEAGNR